MIFPSVRFPHELAVDNAHQLCLGLLLTVRTRQKPGRRFSGCSGLVRCCDVVASTAVIATSRTVVICPVNRHVPDRRCLLDRQTGPTMVASCQVMPAHHRKGRPPTVDEETHDPNSTNDHTDRARPLSWRCVSTTKHLRSWPRTMPM